MTPEELIFAQWKTDQYETEQIKQAMQQADSRRLIPHSTVKRIFVSRYAPGMLISSDEMSTASNFLWSDAVVGHLRSICNYLSEREMSPVGYLQKVFTAVEFIFGHPDIGRPGRVQGTREWDKGIGQVIVVYRERCGDIEILCLPVSSRKWPYAKTGTV